MDARLEDKHDPAAEAMKALSIETEHLTETVSVEAADSPIPDIWVELQDALKKNQKERAHELRKQLQAKLATAIIAHEKVGNLLRIVINKTAPNWRRKE